jgi:uncharacterized delta-60 repeat protein
MKCRLALLVTLAAVFASVARPDAAYSVADLEVSASGKIMVAGSVGDKRYVGDSFTVAMLNPDGSVDPGFADAGVLGIFGGQAATVQPDGKLVVVGYGKGARVHRYRQNGKIDRSFSRRGKPGFVDLTSDPASVSGEDVVVRRTGQILVAAIWYCHGATRGCGYTQSYLHLLRIDAKGRFRGYVSGGDGEQVDALSLAPKRKVIAEVTSDENEDETVIRFKKGGGLDKGFGRDGRRDLGNDGFRGAHLAPLADGSSAIASSLGLSRLTPAGSRDTGFGVAGLATCPRPATPLFVGSLDAVAVQRDQRLVAIGPYCGLVRFTEDGFPDQSFGGSGSVASGFESVYGGSEVAIQPDGRIVIANDGGTQRGFELARFLSDGTPDPSFGIGGRAFVPVPAD